MSTKHFCDACGKETKSCNEFTYLCHIENLGSVHGYRDDDGNDVSGRSVSVDLCHACYNKVFYAAYVAMNKIKLDNNQIVGKTEIIKGA